ncbi:MAG: NUDIX hydrolase [Oscillospiraceae bacterium]|nr:NUDIX hydrolase [Oscillospiraceae bacterium]
MIYKGRAQCLVVRDNKILMVKHDSGDYWCYCLPGGGIEHGETPEQAAIRELQEECCVNGRIIKKTSEYIDPFDDNTFFYTYHIDIDNQTPSLGIDPELIENPILVEVKWLSLDEICEHDRAYLWSAGLVSIKEFAEELDTWSKDISYPVKI